MEMNGLLAVFLLAQFQGMLQMDADASILFLIERVQKQPESQVQSKAEV